VAREASQVLNSYSAFGTCQTLSFDTKTSYLAVTSFNRWRIADTSRGAENLEQDKCDKLLRCLSLGGCIRYTLLSQDLCTNCPIQTDFQIIKKKIWFVGKMSNTWMHLTRERMYLCLPYLLTGSRRKYCPEGPHLFQSQRHREGGAVAGQERCRPANEVHLQRLREPLRQQQRCAAAVAREGAFAGRALAGVPRGSGFWGPRHAHRAW